MNIITNIIIDSCKKYNLINDFEYETEMVMFHISPKRNNMIKKRQG